MIFSGSENGRKEKRNNQTVVSLLFGSLNRSETDFYDSSVSSRNYRYKDHLDKQGQSIALYEVCERSSVRISYTRNTNGTPKVLDTNKYYAFGMNQQGTDNPAVFDPLAIPYNYKYNGKELQETGLYDYGWRMYMPDIGRWNGIDQLAEMYAPVSPYSYVANNPINFTDPDGREIHEDGNGWTFSGADLNLVIGYLMANDGGGYDNLVSQLDEYSSSHGGDFGNSPVSGFWDTFNSNGTLSHFQRNGWLHWGISTGGFGGIMLQQSNHFAMNLGSDSSSFAYSDTPCTFGCHQTPGMDMSGGSGWDSFSIMGNHNETYNFFYTHGPGRKEPFKDPKWLRFGDKIIPIEFDFITPGSPGRANSLLEVMAQTIELYNNVNGDDRLVDMATESIEEEIIKFPMEKLTPTGRSRGFAPYSIGRQIIEVKRKDSAATAESINRKNDSIRRLPW